MGLHEEAIRTAANAENLRHFVRIGLGDEACPQDHHVHRGRDGPPQIGVLRLDGQLAVLPHHDLGAPATDEDHALFSHPLVELLVPFAEGPHIHVELEDFGVGLVSHQVSLLQGVHATHP